ncbi:MAG: diguanylate cyclase, partial [Longimicrobiales bacterium]|nr:diguanylate cyclase [Longimicrobiales bacterium]
MKKDKKETSPEVLATNPRLESELFRLAIQAAPNAMIVVGQDGTMRLVNQAAEKLFGYEAEELVGQPVEILVPSGMRSAHRRLRADFANTPEARPMGGKRDLRAVRRDGSEIHVEIGLSPIETSDGLMVVSSLVGLSLRKRTEEDMAEAAALLGRTNERLLERVATDDLTTLKSRGAFMDHLTAQLEVSVRHARPLSVLILDIDYFKNYNDDFGHLPGDEALRQVGKILKEVARRSDFVARLGGEEFGIILPETGTRGATVIGNRFRKAIEAAEWPHRPVTASLGAMTVDFEQALPRPEA